MAIGSATSLDKLNNLLEGSDFGTVRSIHKAGKLITKIKSGWKDTNKEQMPVDSRRLASYVTKLQNAIIDKRRSVCYRIVDFFIRFFTKLQSGHTVLKNLRALGDTGIELKDVQKLEVQMPTLEEIKDAKLNPAHLTQFKAKDAIPPLPAKMGNHTFQRGNQTIATAKTFSEGAAFAQKNPTARIPNITHLTFRAYGEAGGEFASIMAHLKQDIAGNYYVENADTEILQLLSLFDNVKLPKEESEDIPPHGSIPLLRYDDGKDDVATFERCKLRFYAVIICFAKGENFWSDTSKTMTSEVINTLQNALRHIAKQMKNNPNPGQLIFLLRNMLTCGERTEEAILSLYNTLVLKAMPDKLSFKKILGQVLALFRNHLLTKAIDTAYASLEGYKEDGEIKKVIDKYDSSSASKHYRGKFGPKWGVVGTGVSDFGEAVVGGAAAQIMEDAIEQIMQEKYTPEAIINYIVEIWEGTKSKDKLHQTLKTALQTYIEVNYNYFSDTSAGQVKQVSAFLLDDDTCLLKTRELVALMLEDMGVLTVPRTAKPKSDAPPPDGSKDSAGSPPAGDSADKSTKE